MEMRVARLRALTQGSAFFCRFFREVEMRVARLRALTQLLHLVLSITVSFVEMRVARLRALTQ